MTPVIIFRDTKRSHNAQLRAACETALTEIQELVGGPTEDAEGDSASIGSSSVLPEPSESAKLEADKYFLPFELACQSKTPRLVVVSLDGESFYFRILWRGSKICLL